MDIVVYAAGAGLCLGALAGREVIKTAGEYGRQGSGTLGFILCLVAGFLCGGLPAFAVAWWFNSWIKSQGHSDPYAAAANPGLNSGDLRRAFRDSKTPAPVKPYTEIGPLVVCAACGKATGKASGSIPPECGHCKHPFEVRLPKPKEPREPKAKVRKAAPPPPAPPVDDPDIVPLEVANVPRRRR